MASLLDLIRTAGVQAVDASGPVSVLYGEVMTQTPLSVKVDQRFILTADFLVVPESLTQYEIELKHTHPYADDGVTGEALSDKIVVRPGLQAGDRVILIRVQGGQKYLIMDKVVSA